MACHCINITLYWNANLYITCVWIVYVCVCVLFEVREVAVFEVYIRSQYFACIYVNGSV